MPQHPDSPNDMPPTHGLGIADLWRRIQVAQAFERKERVGFWLGMLLLFVPVFYFLLYFKRYSIWARLGWGFWLGLIVYVKIFGLSDAVVHIETPHEGQEVALKESTEISLEKYLGRLLGAQYMDFYKVDGDALVITYEPDHDSYFGNNEVLADLAISNGFSLLYRRELKDLRLRFPIGKQWREVHMTRAGYREFFGVTEEAMQSYIDPEKAKQSPVYNIRGAEKTRFLQTFTRDIPPPTDPRPAPVGDPRNAIQQPGAKR